MSAIIPVHNGVSFVAEAIESVLAQSHPVHECIVVDDGSTDSTRDVLARFGSRIRTLSQRNRGVAAARNHGAREATGSLLAFLDADDIWLPTKIARQVEMMRNDPGLTLSYTGMNRVDSDLTLLSYQPCPPSESALRNALLLDESCVAVAQTGLIRKEIFWAVGGFDEQLSTSADTDLVCRVALKYKVSGIDQPLVLYRQHSAQMHLNLTAMERDMSKVFERIYRDPRLPAQLRKLRRRSWGRLWFILGASRFKYGEHVPALPYLAKAAIRSPEEFLNTLKRRLTKS